LNNSISDDPNELQAYFICYKFFFAFCRSGSCAAQVANNLEMLLKHKNIFFKTKEQISYYLLLFLCL